MFKDPTTYFRTKAICLYGSHDECTSFIIVACPNCKRLCFTYMDIRNHLVRKHNVKRGVIAYTDETSSYLWI